MYISVYDENKKHIENINNVTFELTQRVYDFDNFSAKGISTIDISNTCFMILNDDEGNYQYACFTRIKKDDDLREIKGQDFRQILNTEILLDYTEENSFSPVLYDILEKVCEKVFLSEDETISKIEIDFIIPVEAKDINTEEFFGNLQNTYKIINAYTFLKGYLKFYEYNLTSKFDEPTGKIIFAFEKVTTQILIDLNDFTSTLETTSNEVNKAVATIKFEPISKDADGNEIITPRPSTLDTKYYYRTKDNQIVEGDEYGNIEGRIYPVIQKIFESEYLASSQYDAVYELANARYVDNIILDNNSAIDPIDLSTCKLYTMFHLYTNGKYYKDLPITEINKKYDATGFQTKVKLGFKKIYLTEIIKGGKT
ncbi:MAG: hypothetical protein KH328_01335 [Staphylococcus sp.]|nr:hypothetical protein [Staphylococcus sp.]